MLSFCFRFCRDRVPIFKSSLKDSLILVLDSLQKITKTRRNAIYLLILDTAMQNIFRFSLKQLRRLLLSYLVVAQLYHSQNFMQDMTQAAF